MGDRREAGRSALRIGLISGVAGALLIASSGAAHAHSKLSAQFHLKGSHHYHVYVTAYRSPRRGTAKGKRHLGTVTITAASRRGFASYTARGRFTRHHIRADFGYYGKVALRFATHSRLRFVAPKSPQERHGIVCTSTGRVVGGKFRGAFRFQGEGRYTSVRAHRVRGEIDRTTKEHCRGRAQYTELKAKSRSVKFLAFSEDEYETDFFAASVTEHVGRVRIDRYAFASAPQSAGEFTFDPSLTTAHVALGGEGPITGGAHFTSQPRSWTGYLTASFPGDENVPMTGGEFHTTLRNVVRRSRH
jgi:hypothetical protein